MGASLSLLYKIITYLISTAAHDFPHEHCHKASIQDLPITDEKCPYQSSKESSDEEWSDFSFYDLPDTLKVSEVCTVMCCLCCFALISFQFLV